MHADNTVQSMESALKNITDRRTASLRRMLRHYLLRFVMLIMLSLLWFISAQIWPTMMNLIWLGPLYFVFFVTILPGPALRMNGLDNLADDKLQADLKHAMSPAHDEDARRALWTEISARMRTKDAEVIVEPDAPDEVCRLAAKLAAERRLQSVLTTVNVYQKRSVWEGWERTLSVVVTLPFLIALLLYVMVFSMPSGRGLLSFFGTQALTFVMIGIFRAFLDATQHRHAQLAVLERQARDLFMFLKDETAERGSGRLKRWIQLRAEHEAQLQRPPNLLGITMAT